MCYAFTSNSSHGSFLVSPAPRGGLPLWAVLVGAAEGVLGRISAALNSVRMCPRRN